MGKKLFLITCNEIRKLNDYLINRLSRFHYHFRFDYPSYKEIWEYLHDKLEEKYYPEKLAYAREIAYFSKTVAEERNTAQRFLCPLCRNCDVSVMVR